MLAKFNGTTADELNAFVLNTITTINKPTLFERLCELSEILAASDIENYLIVSNKGCCLIYRENSHLAVVDNKFFRYNSGAIKKIAKKHLDTKKIKIYLGVYENGTYTKTRFG